MDIWLLKRDSRYTPLDFADMADVALLSGFQTAQPLAHDWPEPDVCFAGPHPLRSNCPGLHTVPAWGLPAMMALFPLVDPFIEILPLNCEQGEYYAIQVLNAPDVLDHSRAMFRRFKGHIIGVDQYAFREEALEGQHIFKLAEDAYSQVFVSQAFRALAARHNLTGLAFAPLPQPSPV